MTVVKVLTPYDVKNEEIKIGVGTPYIIHDIKRNKYWLLFTGWKDPNGLKREAFVAEIDEDLGVKEETIKKIVPKDFPETVDYTHNTVRGIYNPVRDEFYVTTSHGSKIYLFVFDPNWNLKGYKQLIDFGKVKDAGFPIKPFGAYADLHNAVAVSPSLDSLSIELYFIKNIDDLSQIEVQNWGEVARWGRGNDVIDLVTMPRYQIFVEQDTSSKWILHTFIGPSAEELNSTDDLKNLYFLEASLMPMLQLDDQLVQIGHPQYTTLPDGEPKILFASFRDTWSSSLTTKKEGYSHEIWALYVDDLIFDPRSYGELKGIVTGNKWIYVPFARKLYITTQSEGIAEFKATINDDVIEEIKLEKGLNVIDDPLTFIKLKLPSKATVIARY